MQNDLKMVFGNQGSTDEKSLDFLTKALEKNNLKGFDYLEFKLSLARLANMNMAEDMAIKSAFATASTVGLTKEILVSSAQHYKQILAKEKEQFQVAMQNQLNKKVRGKKQEVEKMRSQIEDWKRQIEQLQNQIIKSQATIDGADQQIKHEMEKIENTKQSFENTHQSILSQIEHDLGNIQNYL